MSMTLDKRYFKRLSQCTVPVYCVQKSVNFQGITMPKNSLIVWHNQRMVFCDRFPNGYKGNNPFLTVREYDFFAQVWEEPMPEKSAWTRLLWAMYRSGGQKRIEKDAIVSFSDYADLMKHDRRHKKGTGQWDNPNSITEYDCCHAPQMRARHIEGYPAYMPYGTKEYQTAHA